VRDLDTLPNAYYQGTCQHTAFKTHIYATVIQSDSQYTLPDPSLVAYRSLWCPDQHGVVPSSMCGLMCLILIPTFTAISAASQGDNHSSFANAEIILYDQVAGSVSACSLSHILDVRCFLIARGQSMGISSRETEPSSCNRKASPFERN
jgi:hypothetical protein